MHPECEPETPKLHPNSYMSEINQIATAGERLYKAVGGDDANKDQSFTEMENGYPVRMPVSAFCARLAYFVWNRCRDDARLDSGLAIESDDGKIIQVSKPESKPPESPEPLKIDKTNPVTHAEITAQSPDGRTHTWKGDPNEMPDDHPLRGVMTQMGLLPPVGEPVPQTPRQALDMTLGDLLQTFGPEEFTAGLNRLAGIPDKKPKARKKTKPSPRKEK